MAKMKELYQSVLTEEYKQFKLAYELARLDGVREYIYKGEVLTINSSAEYIATVDALLNHLEK